MIYVWDSEVGPVLNFTVKDSGTAVNITGATVELIVDGLEDFTCTLVVAASGTCKYTMTAGDFPVGKRDAQLKITDSGSNVFYSQKFTLESKRTVG